MLCGVFTLCLLLWWLVAQKANEPMPGTGLSGPSMQADVRPQLDIQQKPDLRINDSVVEQIDRSEEISSLKDDALNPNKPLLERVERVWSLGRQIESSLPSLVEIAASELPELDPIAQETIHTVVSEAYENELTLRISALRVIFENSAIERSQKFQLIKEISDRSPLIAIKSVCESINQSLEAGRLYFSDIKRAIISYETRRGGWIETPASTNERPSISIHQ